MVHPWRFIVHVVLFPLSRSTTGVDAILFEAVDFYENQMNYLFPTGGGEVRRRFDTAPR